MNALSASSGQSAQDVMASNSSEISNISYVSKFVAEAAAHAPSIYNSSPWWFSTIGSAICVRADSERIVPIVDPAGRELTMSCGAAAFTARVALRYLGLISEASVFPDVGVPNLVARLTWGDERRPPSDYERRLFDEVAARRTHRGGFATDRVPAGVMSMLTEAAVRENATLRIMTDGDHRSALLAVLTAADRAFDLNDTRMAEEARWMSPAAGRTINGGWGARPQPESTAPGSPGVVAVLTTADDERADWVRAGQALQRVLLVAGSRGVSVAIEAKPLEFGQLRDFIGSELIGGACPQMVLRFGLKGHG
jgi:hypothetical protein